MRKETFIRGLEVVCWTLSMAWVVLCYVRQDAVIGHSPHVANVATGNVYLYRNHSDTLFIKKSDLIYVQFFSFPLGAVPLLIGTAIIRLVDKERGKQARPSEPVQG
ncbi:hypothetical protein J2800_002771 [Caulobacter rhizosphaerae]|jgi:hypothetical protein|uniref:Uncharacterized protein n=1 Tax=Caulobacter rhizosphaerae TaxID=2010972 RepID=A0ABU1N114_9CAUL|nr:hypothetical protein [Caulobacter rhizosphaerae]MDR6532018.1 hypothetical protein [Caulobacter rhizosphaerae]